MKFKVSEQFLAFITTYIQDNINYTWAQEDHHDFGILDITNNANSITNFENIVA